MYYCSESILTATCGIIKEKIRQKKPKPKQKTPQYTTQRMDRFLKKLHISHLFLKYPNCALNTKLLFSSWDPSRTLITRLMNCFTNNTQLTLRASCSKFFLRIKLRHNTIRSVHYTFQISYLDFFPLLAVQSRQDFLNPMPIGFV